jgi:AcrR family transcriptional regulator
MSVFAPPTNRMERKRLLTRQRLMQATSELHLEVGYSHLTIKAITERADLGYGTFYLYFQDVDEAVWAVVHELAEAQRQVIDAAVEHLPYPLREYRSFVLLFEYAAPNRAGISALFGSQGSAKLSQWYQNYLVEIHEVNLRQGTYSSGLEVPVTFLAQMVSGALMRLLLWWSETPNDYTAEDMARMLYHSLYRQPPPNSPPG